MTIAHTIRLLTAAALVGSAVFLAAQDPAPNRSASSPEIQPHQRVVFRLSAPKAQDVVLNGDSVGGSNVATRKGDGGIWSATVGPLAPELWRYSFSVDGVRMLDPANVDSNRDGRRPSSIFIIRGSESAHYAYNPAIAHGALHQVWYPAATLKMTRRAYIYTPPGHENGFGRSTILYLHPGGGVDENAWGRLDRFRLLSASGGADQATRFKEQFANPLVTSSRIKVFWIAMGKQDAGYDRARQFADELKKSQINHELVETEGAHFWAVRRRALCGVYAALVPPLISLEGKTL